MKNFSAKKRAAVLSAVLLLGAAAASGKTIGDFRQLDQWSGLTAAELTAPNGDPAAVLPAGGTAVFEYTEHKTFLSGRAVDFSDMLDAVCVEDWYDYRYLECWVNLPNADPVDLECTVIPLAVGRPDYAESLASTLRVQGEGWQRVVFPLHDFDYVRHQGAHWKHIHGLKISASGNEDALLISQPRLKKSRLVALGAAVKSKPVKAGETAVYDLQLENESAAVRTVSLVLEHTGWEACPAALSETELTLQPWETKNVTLSVRMNDLVAPGGRELRKITAIPDGRGDLKEELSVITVRELPHPYLMHTEAGWAAVRQKAEAVEWAKAAKQEYIEKARNWRVPAARAKGDYSFNHKAGGDAETCAVAWNLSGDDALAQKVIRYLRAFSDPETGYPATARNSGAFVHRGMFFMHTARAYDLVYDHPSLTAADHANMEASMRLFNGWVDYMLKTGDGNNHQDGLSAGALMNSLVMQDFEQAERFLYGTGGLLDLIGQGVLDDGQYFEGTANYNILAGNIFNSAAVALEPWGLNIKDWKIPAKYGKHVMVSPWALSGEFLGMSFERQGPSTRTYRQLKDIWDAVVPMADWRGVVFASNDSGGIDLAGGDNNEAGFGFDMAYYLWKDPAYVPLLKIMKKRDLIYGAAELPEVDAELGKGSYVNDNVGFAVLRTNAENPRDRYQVVQRYGTHGGYHGHFDKTSLLSLSRFGRSHYNTEASWFGYWSFMFKMWVQTSDAHNMTVVDHRMQKPADNRRILFHSGELMQASASEIETVWIDPPYGGQTPYALKMPEEKTWQEARWLPTPENPRPQGATGTPSEPVMQRRLMITTDDYVVMADYLKGSESHDFDNLFNCMGLTSLAGNNKWVKHTAQCDPDPYSSAQFITDCDWYETDGTAKAAFVLDWSKGEMGGRHSCSEPGIMNVDYYSLWPKKATLMVGNYPESHNVARQLFYKVIGDGKVLKEGQFAPWILGSEVIDVDVKGFQTLEIETRVEKARDLQTIFLGRPKLRDAAGREIAVDFETENIAPSAGANRDYAGGEVVLFGTPYASSIAAEPADRKQAGRLKVNLAGKNAARFTAVLGGDYPVGGDDIHRKIIAARSTGTEARFLSAVEIHEAHPVIQSIEAVSADEIVVRRFDGKTERIRISGLAGGNPSVEMSVEQNGEVIASEQAGNGI